MASFVDVPATISFRRISVCTVSSFLVVLRHLRKQGLITEMDMEICWRAEKEWGGCAEHASYNRTVQLLVLLLLSFGPCTRLWFAHSYSPHEYREFTSLKSEPGYLSRYSDELLTGRQWFDSRQGQAILLYSTAARPALRPIQSSI
jgi:hypothetical protein